VATRRVFRLWLAVLLSVVGVLLLAPLGHGQSPPAVDLEAEAVLTPPGPVHMQSPTSIVANVSFGTTFSSIDRACWWFFFIDPDLFDPGDSLGIRSAEPTSPFYGFGFTGLASQGTVRDRVICVNASSGGSPDPAVTDLLDGHQSYLIRAESGSFTLATMKVLLFGAVPSSPVVYTVEGPPLNPVPTVPPGGAVQFEETIRAYGDSPTGPVTVTATSNIPHATITVMPPVGVPTFTATVDVQTSASTPAGTYHVLVTARAGAITRTDNVLIRVQEPPPTEPAVLDLRPPTDANPVGTQHCVTAYVTDALLRPVANATVRFTVAGANPRPLTTRTTDTTGTATYCYTGTTAGVDTITAYADSDRDSVQDAGEPADVATKTWSPLSANTIELHPKVASNAVGTTHCVTASVRDIFLNPVPNATVRFVVTGSNSREGADNTDAAGFAEFCYEGRVVGEDIITAYVDQDNDRVRDPAELADVATKNWSPGIATAVIVQPPADTNPVGTEHCVTAYVRDTFGNEVPEETVFFQVVGVNPQPISRDVTNEFGAAEYCYTGRRSGQDVITATADTNDNNQPDDPARGTATKTWTAGKPTAVVLEPTTDTNVVGDEHCVHANVRDEFQNPVPDVRVQFTVTGANPQPPTFRTTDETGTATYCYTGTRSGVDTITAVADADGDGAFEPGEPTGVATKVWSPGRPANITLQPKTDINPVDTTHCVVAVVRDVFGNPVPDTRVVFDVTGASEDDTQPADEDAVRTTDENGNAEHCYTGPDLPGVDAITAYVDDNNDGAPDPDVKPDVAEKTWKFPTSTPGCEVTITNGGWITTATGSKGTFGGNARVEADGTTKGEEEYHDHGLNLNFHSIEIVAVVCSADFTRADIYGTGEVNGAGPVDFRIRVSDLNEPGSQPTGPDTYQILAGPYVSGPEDNPLQGGNIQIHGL
jgi:Bacterial Ig-like domain (group 1)